MTGGVVGDGEEAGRKGEVRGGGVKVPFGFVRGGWVLVVVWREVWVWYVMGYEGGERECT